VEAPAGGGGGGGGGGSSLTLTTSNTGGSSSTIASESRASTGSTVLSSAPLRKRHPSPTLSTASTTSSTSATSEGRRQAHQLGPKFGAASPQSVRKMLALSEPSKTRPYQAPRAPLAPCALSMALPVPGPLQHSMSPSPSPAMNRRTAVPLLAPNRASHERCHSDTASMPVDLNAESSSVSSLPPLRKSHMSGSATSSDSGSSMPPPPPPPPLGLGLTLGIGLGISN